MVVLDRLRSFGCCYLAPRACGVGEPYAVAGRYDRSHEPRAPRDSDLHEFARSIASTFRPDLIALLIEEEDAGSIGLKEVADLVGVAHRHLRNDLAPLLPGPLHRLLELGAKFRSDEDSDFVVPFREILIAFPAVLERLPDTWRDSGIKLYIAAMSVSWLIAQGRPSASENSSYCRFFASQSSSPWPRSATFVMRAGDWT